MPRKRRGRGEGSIYRRRDGRWTAGVSAGYYPNGRRRRGYVYGDSKKEVQDQLDALRQEARRGVLGDGARLTLCEFLDTWLANAAKETVSPTTWTRYEQHVRLWIKPHLGTVRLAKLSTMHIEKFYGDLKTAGASDSERRKCAALVSQALKHAVRRKLIPYNPSSDMVKPRAQPKEMHPFDAEQSNRFLKAAETDRLYALYAVALDSGARQGELFALRWDDVDFDSNTIFIQRSLEEIKGRLRIKETKTAKARRRIDLSRFAIDALADHRKAMLAEGHDVRTGTVFCDTTGNLLRKSNVYRRSFLRVFRKENQREAMDAALVDREPILLPVIRFHDLRHTMATLLLKAGENVKVVSERLGHASIEITLNIYAHCLPGMQKRAAETLDGIFSRGAKREVS